MNGEQSNSATDRPTLAPWALNLPPAQLEGWMRQYYFDTEIDIGSSGVQSFSLRELREMLGITTDDLDAVVFDDSCTLGGDGLRQAVATRWAHGRTESVMATHGSSEAIFLVMNALLNAGDEVIFLDPSYPQLFSIAESIGCRMQPWRLRFERQFAPDLEELKSLINARTRMVVVNFPHNPTGATLTPEAQRELVSAVARVGAYLVWDGAFTELVYERAPLPDPALTYERAVSLGTLSKAYGLPGLRVGWCVAAPAVLERMVHLRDYITLHLSPLVELIAQRAVERADLLLAERLPQARRNLDLLSAWAAAQGEGIEWARPQGGVSSFPRLPGVRDVRAFCHQAGQAGRVLLVPGHCFGHPRHVRLGFGGATGELEKGLARLSSLLKATPGPRAHANAD
jgi:capreomycidine synthase